MSISRFKTAVAGLVALALCGCATPSELFNSVDNFGEANRQTFAAQVIDPEPEYDNAVAASSGDQVSKAIDRYRSDTVKQPETEQVSEVGGSGGR